jgi:hypothetical protein
MITVLRVVLALLGALFVFVGAQFLVTPVAMGADFGLEPIGNAGLSSIRGDLTAFFWVAGGALLYGVIKQRGDVFYVTAALMGIVFCARCLSLVLDGPYEGFAAPMVIEAVTVILCLFGARAMAGRP